MDFVQQLHKWAEGDIVQGKMMIGFVILFIFPLIVLSVRSENSLLKGMLIPLSLLLIVNLTYGGYLLLTKIKTTHETERRYNENAHQIFEKELADREKDYNSYIIFKRVWALGIIVSVLLYFVSEKEYWKGMSLGFILMFLMLLIVDTHFHARLKLYLTFLQKMS